MRPVDATISQRETSLFRPVILTGEVYSFGAAAILPMGLRPGGWMGDFISYFRSVDWQTLLAGAALGGVSSAVALFVRTVIQQPVKALTEQSRIIEWFWWLSRQQPFKGSWKTVWHVESDRYPAANVDSVRVRRLFSNVTFTSIATLNDGSTQKCVFVGKLLDRSVTGRWFNPEDQERGYFGAFQFRVHGSLRSAKGVWIGWRNDGTVAAGDMTLAREK